MSEVHGVVDPTIELIAGPLEPGARNAKLPLLSPSDIVLAQTRSRLDAKSIESHTVASMLQKNSQPSSLLQQYGAANAGLAGLLSGFAISIAILLLERRGSNVSRASRADRHLHRTCIALMMLSCALLAISAGLAVIVSGLPSYSLQSLLVYQSHVYGFTIGTILLFYALYLALLQNSNRDEFVAARRVFYLCFAGAILFGAFQALVVPPCLSVYDEGDGVYTPFFLVLCSTGVFCWHSARLAGKLERSKNDEGVLHVAPMEIADDVVDAGAEFIVAGSTNYEGLIQRTIRSLEGSRPRWSARWLSWQTGAGAVGLLICVLAVQSFSGTYPEAWKALAGCLTWAILVSALMQHAAAAFADRRLGSMLRAGVRQSTDPDSKFKIPDDLQDLLRQYRKAFMPYSDYYLIRTELFVGLVVLVSLVVAIVACVSVRFSLQSDYGLILATTIATCFATVILALHGGILVFEQEAERGVVRAVVKSKEVTPSDVCSVFCWDGREADRSDCYFLLARTAGSEVNRKRIDLPKQVSELQAIDSYSPRMSRFPWKQLEQATFHALSEVKRAEEDYDEEEYIKWLHDLASNPEEWSVVAILPLGRGEKGVFSAIEPVLAKETSCEISAWFRSGSREYVVAKHSKTWESWRIIYFDEDTGIQHSSPLLTAKVAP